jgi:hypothetical protein
MDMQLEDRMKLTVPGQVTWADPSKNAKCLTCDHVSRLPVKEKTGTHVCQLTKAHTRKRGIAFTAGNAIACSMYAS